MKSAPRRGVITGKEPIERLRTSSKVKEAKLMFIHPPEITDAVDKQLKAAVTGSHDRLGYSYIYPSQAPTIKYLQGPFNIFAIVPVDSFGRNIFIKGVTTQFAT
jgi:hypothetical protein